MSQKKMNKGKRKNIENQNTSIKMLPLAIGILLMIAGVIGIAANSDETAEWSVSDDGILSYTFPENIEYTLENGSAIINGTYIVKTVTFESRGSDIEALIRIPAAADGAPGVVVLPGAGVSKEKQLAIPELLARNGYASITIDQRNLGAIDHKTDMELFLKGKEPVEYMMVYDALAAAKVLAEQAEVNGENISMIGLSNGGRFAIIATAIDPSIKGVIGISTCGYDSDSIELSENVDSEAYRFYRSIDPDIYLEKISPRRFVMMHSLNDSIIPYEMAELSFEKAEEPKAIYAFNGSAHGYSSQMEQDLINETGIILQ
ncbi:MAG: dienelactone hydrolase family protein [Methanolobus sp.]